MAVAFTAAEFGAQSSSATSLAVDLSERSVGELAFALIGRGGAGDVSSAPSGWTQLEYQPTTAAAFLYCKVLTADDLASLTWSWGAVSARTLIQLAYYAGHDPDNPIAASEILYTAGPGTSIPCPAVTSDLPMIVQFIDAYATSALTCTTPVGYSERLDYGSSTPRRSQCIADTNGSWAGGKSEPTFTLSGNGSYVASYQVAVNPAATPPPASGFMVPRWPGVW